MANLTVIDGARDGDVAGWIAERLSAALARTGGEVAVAFPGGNTAFPIMSELAARADIDWPRLAIWAGDDRLVAEDHPASNVGRMRAILQPTGAKVVALRQDADPPHFALVWLGMGADGHIASLFPSSDPAPDDPLAVRRIAPDPLPPDAPFERLTLTLPALLDSDELLLVIRSEAKARLFREAAKGGNDLPVARLLAAARQPVTCFT